jgi:hypothetical protein
MSLKSKVKGVLDGWGSFSAPPRTLEVEGPAGRLVCEIESLDRVGCSFVRLALGTEALKGASMDRLRKVAESLSKRITYLLEDVGPVEVDADRCVVQMRSRPPHRGDGETSYYELLVQAGGEIALCRYSKRPDQDRSVVSAHVTREVLDRLVGDFEGVVA